MTNGVGSFSCPNCEVTHDTPHGGPPRARQLLHFFTAYCSTECRDGSEVREALAEGQPKCDQCGARGYKEVAFIKLNECGKVPGSHCSRACWEAARDCGPVQ